MVTATRGEILSREALPGLLAEQGQLFSEELGIRLDTLEPGELFKWFLASLLFGARITESVAVRTYRAFAAGALLTPQAMAAADTWDLLAIMGECGYTRYDGITSEKTQEAAKKLLLDYGGDLNAMHEAALDSAGLAAGSWNSGEWAR